MSGRSWKYWKIHLNFNSTFVQKGKSGGGGGGGYPYVGYNRYL